MDNRFYYDGGDRARLIYAKDCKKYAKHRLDISEATYWRQFHPYVSQVMSYTGGQSIQKGRFMDFLNLVRRTTLSLEEAADIWLEADYWRDSAEVRRRFAEEIEAFT